MINPNELRIGNLIFSRLYQAPETVGTIYPKGITVVREEGDARLNILVDNEMDGIPLTPERLEQAGYKSNHGRYEKEFRQLRFLELAQVGELWQVSIMDQVSGESREGVSDILAIQYVHQLQNFEATLIN